MFLRKPYQTLSTSRGSLYCSSWDALTEVSGKMLGTSSGVRLPIRMDGETAVLTRESIQDEEMKLEGLREEDQVREKRKASITMQKVLTQAPSRAKLRDPDVKWRIFAPKLVECSR
jgi:hypothetical protein